MSIHLNQYWRFTWTGSNHDLQPVWDCDSSPNAQVFGPITPPEYGPSDLVGPSEPNIDHHTPPRQSPVPGAAIQQTEIGFIGEDSRAPPDHRADQHQQPANAVGSTRGTTGHTTSVGELANPSRTQVQKYHQDTPIVSYSTTTMEEVIDVCTKAARFRNLEENADDRTLLETMLEEIYLYEEVKDTPMEVVIEPIRQKKPRTIFIRPKTTTSRNAVGTHSSSTATTSAEIGLQTSPALDNNPPVSSRTTRTTSASPSRADSRILTSVLQEHDYADS